MAAADASKQSSFELRGVNDRDMGTSGTAPALDMAAHAASQTHPLTYASATNASADVMSPTTGNMTSREAGCTEITTVPGIGPASDKPSPLLKESSKDGKVLQITLLLTSGSRHPFRLDQEYLKKRGVVVENDDPVNMSLYKLKELILREWRDEWDPKPTNPDAIRLISFGKLLADRSRLLDNGFVSGASPAIVHMAIKPQDLIEDEDGNKNARLQQVQVSSPGCRCVIM